MFTGIVEDLGRVATLSRSGGGARLVVETKLATGDQADLKLGDSVAVNGACLTVVAHDRSRLSFDVSLESLDRTSLGALTSGQRVHLERALRLGSRLDGHLVQGHVDGLARLAAKDRAGEGWSLSYTLPAPLLPQVVEKGSVALDGVSLTIARLVGDRISVAVVPHTAASTLLVETPLGGAVNVETDILGKYVQRVLSFGAAGAPREGGRRGLDLGFLAEHGFTR